MNRIRGLSAVGGQPSALRLFLPLSWIDAPQGSGVLASQDAYQVLFGVNGAFWTPVGWSFDPVDDGMSAAASDTTHLDFPSVPFSFLMGIRTGSDWSSYRMLFQKGGGKTGIGYRLYVDMSRRLVFSSYHSGSERTTISAPLEANADYTIGFSRNGDDVRLLVNGDEPDYVAKGNHANIDSAAGASFAVGVGATGTYSFGGLIKYLAVWEEAVPIPLLARMGRFLKGAFP